MPTFLPAVSPAERDWNNSIPYPCYTPASFKRRQILYWTTRPTTPATACAKLKTALQDKAFAMSMHNELSLVARQRQMSMKGPSLQMQTWINE